MANEDEEVEELVGSKEEEEEQEKVLDRQIMIPGEDVKSNAVIKFETIKTPAKFIELQVNTDLKEAPSNWLQGGSKWEHLLRDASLGKDHSFSSFNMAHSYPDLAGSIDVISDAKNIKRLLKMPYSKNHVSMMVHRVGDTLLLDEFDIHKHLLRKQETDWEWMRKFFYETVLESVRAESAKVVKKNKSRDHLKNRNMFSKFLYYSLAENDKDGGLQSERPASSSMERSFDALDLIPDPLHKSNPEDADHMRTVVWNFEDIHMLIGTDLPIFGGCTHPCVSLRLRDMQKPINILTGLDYWLDNLMCNVPEIAMCYHLDGIVQGYELFKTEDIPHLKNSQFSPTVVKDIAQNILSFLKSNATKEGHTYWLFKGHDDDIVKLYDLSTLCEAREGHENPFTIPVAILLYRVARNMRQMAGRKKSTTILRLLKNSLLLLGDNVAYAQVFTSAHYLLSDLYLSDNIYNPDEAFEDSDESDAEDESSQGDVEEEKSSSHHDSPASSVAVQALSKHQTETFQQHTVSTRQQSITGTLADRCAEALGHIVTGLTCLDQNAAEYMFRSKHKVDPQQQPDPNEAIPLYYQPLNLKRNSTDRTDSLVSKVSDSHQSHMPISLPEGTWHKLSKTLMLKKAAVSYHSMAACSLSECKYGQVLRYANLGLMCLETMGVLMREKLEDNLHIGSGLLCLAGDAHLQMTQEGHDLHAHQEQYKDMQDHDLAIHNSISLDLQTFECSELSEPRTCPLDSIQAAIACYRQALEKSPALPESLGIMVNMKKRLGNALNVLGIHHMNRATQMLNATTDESQKIPQIKKLCEDSYHSLQESIQVFEYVEDKVNSALIYSNIARLMRLMAQLGQGHKGHGLTSRSAEFTDYERHCYTQATESYLKAIDLLEEETSSRQLLESMRWELSRTFFTVATLMQDYAPLSKKAEEQIEKEVTKFMKLSLKYCDVNKPTCRYQAATIHHRLASLYQNAYRNQVKDDRKRELRQLAETHYDQATSLFTVSDNPCELLRLTLERFAMNEFQLQGQTSQQKKLKTLNTCLTLLLSCAPYLKMISLLLPAPEDSTGQCQQAGNQGYQQEAEKLAPILYSRLQHVMLTLVKTSAPPSKKSKPTETRFHQGMRSFYDKFLKAVPLDWENSDIRIRCQQLADILTVLVDESPKTL